MKLLLLGANGQVGGQLRRSLHPLGEVISLTADSTGLCGDLGRLDKLADTIRTIRPDAVVNAAAYTAVDQAESDSTTAFAINATACEVLARETARLGAWLIHYSTDYVYDGSGESPWTETDATAPLNAYGRSKLAGDQAIAASNPRHFILRASWVYDARGRNFLKSILQAARTRDTLQVVADQWGAPTAASLIADVTAHLLPRLADSHAGVYHLAAAGCTNWHTYATYVVQQALACGVPLRATPDRVHAIPSSGHPTLARRPSNSRLETSRLRDTFGVELPPWQEDVRAVVTELAGQAAPTV